jgi:hypothetical protein
MSVLKFVVVTLPLIAAPSLNFEVNLESPLSGFQ